MRAKDNGIKGPLTLCESRGAASRRNGRALAFLIFPLTRQRSWPYTNPSND